MKRLIYFMIVMILFTITGCKKFLAEKSQDEIRPSNVKELASFMATEGYPYKTKLDLVMNLLSDDAQCNGGQGVGNALIPLRKGKGPFSWSRTMFEDLLLPEGVAGKTYVNSWAKIYENIAGCNAVLSYADRVEGAQIDKGNLKGQALAMRAYYYFLLVNMYGKPYNAPGVDPESSMGVVLKLKMEVTDSLYSRSSVAQVYRQIESDLKTGLDLLIANPQTNSVYKISDVAIYTLLSRVYLYQEKWDLVIENANKALAKKSELSQLSSFNGATGYYIFNSGNNSQAFAYQNRIYDVSKSKEIIWTYRPNPEGEQEFFPVNLTGVPWSNTFDPPFQPAASLMSLYDSRPFAENAVYIADLRPRLYFTSTAFVGSGGLGYKLSGGGMGGAGIRTAELYLNRAEANIHKYLNNGDVVAKTSALNDLNTLRMSRYDTRKPYVAVSIEDGAELLNFCRDERRREFPFDGHRWFDLRRYGMPSVTHRFEETAGTVQVYTLDKGDNRYTLPIPAKVIERNGMIIQNP
jgi:hypothetical protein